MAKFFDAKKEMCHFINTMDPLPNPPAHRCANYGAISSDCIDFAERQFNDFTCFFSFSSIALNLIKVGFFQKVMAKFSNLSNRHACEPKIVPELLFPVHVINKILNCIIFNLSS